jgi:hypothetical protein
MYNFLTIGNDCSPAAALRDLNLREFALPFDWIQINITHLEKCLEDNFINFHCNLKLNKNKSRLIDTYDFEYPHDYPLTNMTNIEVDNIGEGIYGEDKHNKIISNWMDYYNTVKEKYNRRIERFKNIIQDSKPIIVLCRYCKKDILRLQQLFIKYYNRNDIYFLNSDKQIFLTDKIITVYTEKNNIWNETQIWKEGLNNIISKIN